MAEKKKTTHLKKGEAEQRLELFDYIIAEYNLIDSPKHLFILLTNIHKGAYHKIKEPISFADLLYMWKAKQDYLNKTYEYNMQHGKEMYGVDRVKYDLAILINKYDSYKQWKLKQEAIHQQEERIKKNISYSKAVKQIQPKQHREDDNIDNIIDEI